MDATLKSRRVATAFALATSLALRVELSPNGYFIQSVAEFKLNCILFTYQKMDYWMVGTWENLASPLFFMIWILEFETPSKKLYQ